MDLSKGKYKIKVSNAEESKKVQTILFKHGCYWSRGYSEPKYLDEKGLYIEDGDLSYSSDAGSYFEGHSSQEILVSSILSGSPLKVPTHVVIWDEEDEDPSKFFTNENEAKEFAKELSEKKNVIKDSILLVEIKSVKKMSVKKTLLYSQYKVY